MVSNLVSIGVIFSSNSKFIEVDSTVASFVIILSFSSAESNAVDN